MKVEDVMTTEIQCCDKNTSLDQIAAQMWEHNCGAIPVVDENSKPVGMVTDRDIAMCCTINHKAPWELQASTVLGDRSIYSCSQDTNIALAMNLMKNHKVRRLPVTDSEGTLVGLLSIDDAIARSENNRQAKELSYEITMNTLKAVAIQP